MKLLVLLAVVGSASAKLLLMGISEQPVTCAKSTGGPPCGSSQCSNPPKAASCYACTQPSSGPSPLTVNSAQVSQTGHNVNNGYLDLEKPAVSRQPFTNTP